MPTSGKIIKGIIEEIAKAYPYPFNDYSTIPNYYLIKEAETSNGTIFIDGTGGDACFGSPILGMHPIKRFFFNLYSNNPTPLIMLPIGLSRRLRGREIGTYPFSFAPECSILSPYWLAQDIKVSTAMSLSYKDIISDKYKTNFYARTTLADIIHVCSDKTALKTYRTYTLQRSITVLPLSWLSVLDYQGKLRWDIKIKNKRAKMLLKKFLSQYYSRDFIYRPKSGFSPPFTKWLSTKEVANLFRDILLDKESICQIFFNKNALQSILWKLESNAHKLSGGKLYLLWGALFTDLWLKTWFKD